MAELGVDFSYARVSGATLAANGVKGAGRYLVTDARGLQPGEYEDLASHGVGLWLVYEGAANGMLGGKAQGVTDAHAALARASALGLTGNFAIYWAADFDIAPTNTAYIAAADAYVAGWNTIIPAGRRGGYGGLWYLHHISAAIDFRWECASTSFRHGILPNAVDLHLQQTTLTPPVAGTDHNYILQTNYGQVGSEADMPLTTTDLTNIALAVLQHPINNNDTDSAATLGHLWSRVNELDVKLSKLVAGIKPTVDPATITAAVSKAVATLQLNIDSAGAEALATALAQHLELEAH